MEKSPGPSAAPRRKEAQRQDGDVRFGVKGRDEAASHMEQQETTNNVQPGPVQGGNLPHLG